MLMSGDNKKDKKGFSGLSSLITDIAGVETAKTNSTTESQASLIKKTSAEKLQQAHQKSKTDVSNDESHIIVTCQNCGIQNRLNADYKDFIVKCGKCSQPLFSHAESSKEDEERILCGDDKCVGAIGHNGRCNYCGKTHSEGSRTTITENKIREEKLKKEAEARNKRKILLKNIYYIAFAVCLIFILIISIFIANRDKPNQSPFKISESKGKPKPATGLRIKLKPDKPNLDTSILKKKYSIFSALNKEQIMILQEMLLTLGYDIGGTDGIFGFKTLSSLIQFSEDFHFMPGDDFPDDFFKLAYFHTTIAADHIDWREIYISNEMENWINKKSTKTKQEILNYGIDNPKVIKYLLGLYKFNKYHPKPLSLPRNGILRKNYEKGIAPLKIKTKHKNQHHYIKLSDQSNDQEILNAFIRGGTSLTIDVPLGSYKIKAAVGSIWYGNNFLFGPETAYSAPEKIFEFKVIGDQVSGYSLEFYLQPHGNLKTKNISPFDF